MNRRSFFNKLSLAVVGVYLGCQVKLPAIVKPIVEPEHVLLGHNFESNLFHFLPSFQDFLVEHIKHNEEQDVYEVWQVFQKPKWEPNMGSIMRGVKKSQLPKF